MEYRRFRRTNLEVSAIEFGTWPIGGGRYGTSDKEATLPQLVLTWVLNHRVVTTALVGAHTEREITDGVGATAIHLTSHDLAEIDASEA